MLRSRDAGSEHGSEDASMSLPKICAGAGGKSCAKNSLVVAADSCGGAATNFSSSDLAALESAVKQMLAQLATLSETVPSELAAIRAAQTLHAQALEELSGHMQDVPEKLEELSEYCSSSAQASPLQPPPPQPPAQQHRRGSASLQGMLSSSSHRPSQGPLVRPSMSSGAAHRAEEVGALAQGCRESTLLSAGSCGPRTSSHPACHGGKKNSLLSASFISVGSMLSPSRMSSWGAGVSSNPSRPRQSTVQLQLVSEIDELAAESVLASETPIERSPSLVRHGSISSIEPLDSSRWAKCMVKPNSHLRLLWDVAVIAAIIATIVVAPIALVYHDGSVFSSVADSMAWALHTSDAIWTLNIFISLRTGFFEEGRLLLDPVIVAKKYAQKSLLVDLLSLYPFCLSSAALEARLCLLLFKLTRMLRIIPLFSRLQREFRSTMLLPVKVFVSVMLLVHLMSCAWRLAQGRVDSDNADSIGWGHFYVEDAYWVLMTMTTVGYGDISPQNTVARLYAIFVMMMSPIFFGTIVSGLTHVTKETFADPVETRIAEAARFMARRGVSQHLQRRVEHNLRQHIHQERLSAIDPDLIAMLSPSVQRELALELLSSIVLRFPLFRSAPYSFVAELATTFAWILCMSGDSVVEEGHIVEEAHFVMHGRLHIDSTRPENLLKHRARIMEEGPLEFGVGAWFGEACLFRSGITHKLSATALVDTEMATLQASQYHRIAEKYPRVAEQHKNLGKAVEEKRASIQQLAYKASGPLPKASTSSFRISLYGRDSRVRPSATPTA